MDLPAALTLVFAGIGALGTVYSVVDGFAKRRAEGRRDVEALEANWSLTARAQWRAGHFALFLTCNDVIATPIRVVTVALVGPQGARLCLGQLLHGEGPPNVEPIGDVWTPQLALDRDLHGTVAWGDGQRASIDWVILHLMVKPPRDLAGHRGRFRLAVIIEERTAARRRRHLQVASQEVEFGAQVDPDAS